MLADASDHWGVRLRREGFALHLRSYLNGAFVEAAAAEYTVQGPFARRDAPWRELGADAFDDLVFNRCQAGAGFTAIRLLRGRRPRAPRPRREARQPPIDGDVPERSGVERHSVP